MDETTEQVSFCTVSYTYCLVFCSRRWRSMLLCLQSCKGETWENGVVFKFKIYIVQGILAHVMGGNRSCISWDCLVWTAKPNVKLVLRIISPAI